MAKKSKKRQLEADSNVDEKIGTKMSVDTDSPKKKLKVSPGKSEKKDESSVKQNDLKIKDLSKKNVVQNATNKLDAKASKNTVEGKKLKKKNKKNAEKQEKLENSADNKTTPSDSNNDESTKSKRKEFFQKKRAEFKEKQKQLGNQAGLTATLSKLSLTEMKKRIADIESRETISKTAVRRLRILKKKVQVLESGGSVETLTEKDGTSENISKEHEKNRLQKKKNTLQKITNVKAADHKVDSNKSIHNKKKQKPAAKDLEKNVCIEDRIGDTAQDSPNDSKEKKNGLNIEKLTKNMKKLKKVMSSNSNTEKNDEIESDSDEDDDENMDEDDDESENDSKEETNESDNEESNADSNEGENTIEKIETDKTISVAKVKKAQKKPNQDSNKPKFNPSETDPNKKQRYVLFVGNIAYDATTVDVKKHFLTKVEKVKDVRIPLNPGTNKPRGFAYVEVDNSEDYEKALSLHHTFINGRQIKVEYTTSGSKKASRNPEVIHKNKKLHALRKDGKLAGSKKFSNKRSFRRNFKNNPNKGFSKKES